MATQNTPTPTPTVTATMCHFAGMPSRVSGQLICPAGTAATLDVQIGSPGQSRIDHFKTCKACATRMSDLRNERMDQKRAGKLPDAEVLDVVVCSSAKVAFFANAARKNGEGLVARTFPACSGQHWDGGPCPNSAGGKAIAYGGIKYELCKSCEVAANLVAVRDKHALGIKLTPMIKPLPTKDADIRAKRQAEELATRKPKKTNEPTTPQPQNTDGAIDFEAFILASKPVKSLRAESSPR